MTAFARKAEDLGFDTLWVAEHFLEAPGLSGTGWMSPLLCLAHGSDIHVGQRDLILARRLICGAHVNAKIPSDGLISLDEDRVQDVVRVDSHTTGSRLSLLL